MKIFDDTPDWKRERVRLPIIFDFDVFEAIRNTAKPRSYPALGEEPSEEPF